MFIKEITLCGFKSYKEETKIVDLDQGLNVIVGRNGSGKSNIFTAIEFALTMEYRHLKTDARPSLISHGRAVQDSSFVEIVFDNTDRKLPVSENIVKFRRMLAVKKDRFYVNGRELQLTNVKQFLDIAGFTNPYFIVKQGKVHDLALASDRTRLKILSDVIGISVFDEKISDCKESLKSAEEKKRNIEIMLTELKQRKSELEQEVAEQQHFMKLDQAKRAMEYIIHENQLKEIQQKLSDLEVKREEAKKRQDPVRKEVEENARDLQINQRDFCEMKEKIKHLEEIKKDHEISRDKLTTNLESCKQTFSDLINKNQSTENVLPKIELEISKTNEQLQKVEEEVDNLKSEMDALLNKKCKLDTRVEMIREKEVGRSKFKKSSDYQKHVKSKLSSIELDMKETTRLLDAMKIEENNSKEDLISEKQVLETLQKDLSSCLHDIREANDNIERYKTEECIVKTKLEKTIRQLFETEQELRQKRERVSRLEEEWKKYVGSDIFVGWMAVRKIIEDFRTANSHQEVVSGYYGLACEIIQCEPQLDLAVESAGGNRLMYHVVDSKEIAQTIVKEFNKRQCPGEINFLPLNALKLRNETIPDGLPLAKPITEQLHFDDKFSKLVKFIFGSTLVCVNLEAAAGVMRQYKLPCVTVEGETVSKVGVMTGGYFQNRPQKLELQRAKTAAEAKLAKLMQVKSTLDAEYKLLAPEFKTAKHNREKYYLKKCSLEQTKQTLISKIETSRKKVELQKQHVLGIERKIQNLNLALSELAEKEKVLNSGSQDDKSSAIGNSREAKTEFNKVEKEFTAKTLALASLETKLQQLERQYYKEVEMSNQYDDDANHHEITRLTEVINSLNLQLTENQKKMDEVVEELTVLQEMVIKKSRVVENLSEKDGALKQRLASYCQDLESYASSYSHWQTKLEEHKMNAGNLGSIPSGVDKYIKFDNGELYSKLKKVNLKLKGCKKEGINQKAMQQYEDISNKCKEFDERLSSRTNEKNELTNLLQDLESKKGEAMLKNVRELQQQFRKTFCRIVPNGNAELILYGDSITIDREQNIENEEIRRMAGQSLFEGVKVLANFVGTQLNNKQSLAQLSGGQKSIIALCLILAIQTIDPVPFYLFDEVDQALDTAYRDAVAKVIGEMAEQSQFICTTFRGEFIEVADKVYGVACRNQNSHIQEITDTQALEFVESESSSDSQTQVGSPDSIGSVCVNAC